MAVPKWGLNGAGEGGETVQSNNANFLTGLASKKVCLVSAPY